MDYGDRYTDKKISAVNRELRKTYRTAQAELKKKLADFEKRHARENQRKKDQLAAGKISQQDYKDWLTGQVFIRNQWQANLRQVCQVMQDCNKQAMNIVNTSRFDVFAENYNYNAWKAERSIAVSFNLYNAESVARLINGDPQLLPEWKIDEPKDYRWNQKKVNNIIRQGIIQGEGIPEITDRLCRDLATGNENKMRMFARTALGAAQSAGRQKQMEDAAAMGIEVHKRWIAAHDSRTRDAHRDLDGQEVPYDKPFDSELGEIMFPKDPTAEPANVFNCRCTMRTIYPKYEDRSKQYGEGETIDGQTYEEWKKGKQKRGEVQKEKTVEDYDAEISALREKRQRLFEQDSYDKSETDRLMNQIFALEDEKAIAVERENKREEELNKPIAETDKEITVMTTKGEEINIKKKEIDDYEFPNGEWDGYHEKGKAIEYTLPDGTKFYFKAGMKQEDQGLTPSMLARAYYEVPEEIRTRGQKKIDVVDYNNPKDGYWAKRYKWKGFKSYMNGGDSIEIWKHGKHDYKYLVGSLAHEMGHKIDRDNGVISDTTEWRKAKTADQKVSGKKSPREYGEKNDTEDFAVSVENYTKDKKNMEQNFPNRTRIIKRLLGAK